MQEIFEARVVKRSDIRSLNTEKLRYHVLKGIYTLESALFHQAELEYNRIAQFRNLLSHVEEEIFHPNNFQTLSNENKIQAYNVLSKNMHSSLSFLQELHKNISHSMESLSQIEKAKPTASNTNVEDLEGIKEIVRRKLQQKLNIKS